MNALAQVAPTDKATGVSPGMMAMLIFAVAVVVTTEFIVVGLLPVMARALGVSIVEAGWFVTWFALSSAALGPILTIAAGGMEPRRVLAAAMLAFATGSFVVVLLPNYWVIVAVRIVQGAALPVLVSIGSAFAAQLAGPGREGRAIALVNLGVVIGIVLAIPAGVFVADRVGWQASFGGLAFLALAAALLIGVSFPRLALSDPPSIGAQAGILRGARFQAHLLLSGALFTAMFCAYTYLAAYLETVGGLAGNEVALILMGFGAAGMIGNWIAGRIVDRGPTAATAAVAAVLAFAMTGVSLAGGKLYWLLPVLGFWGAAHTAGFVLCQVRVMLAGGEARAFASSLNISVCNLGIALGAVAGGWVIDRHGIEAVGLGGAALAVGALVVALLIMAAPARSRPSVCEAR
ncbi:MAG: MFS transporter [Rhizobiaceae bacterium]|nr:MFS transporter [Rhizobiaceae bacterium]MCV0409074.1 MFS transporter [Rhizobiaceae bacterium]